MAEGSGGEKKVDTRHHDDRRLYAKSYLLKDTDGDDIAAAIEGAIAGQIPVAPQIAE